MSETKVDPRLRVGEQPESSVDAYFSADVETDGPIPGPFSMLSFAIVYAGSFDGQRFERPKNYERFFYQELKVCRHPSPRPMAACVSRSIAAQSGPATNLRAVATSSGE